MSEIFEAEISIGETGNIALTPREVTAIALPSDPATAEPVKVKFSVEDLEEQAEECAKRMANIVEMVSDPDAQLADISRQIALEIAFVIALMSSNDPAYRKGRSFRDLNDHVKALRELQKTLTESDSLSRRDVLNLDGPKFQFVLRKLLELFKKALKDANVEDSLAKSVMLHVGDSLKENDENIRRELNKIEIGR